jgi:hypothetical protein
MHHGLRGRRVKVKGHRGVWTISRIVERPIAATIYHVNTAKKELLVTRADLKFVQRNYTI